MTTPDPRLGETNTSTGVIVEYPTQYADGTTYTRAGDPAPVQIIFSSQYFSYLRNGVAIDDATYATLLALAGGTDVQDFDTLMSDLGLTRSTIQTVFDEFSGNSLDATNWSDDAGGGAGTIAVPNANGLTIVKLTTGTVNNDFATVAGSGLKFPANSGQIMVTARVRLSALTTIIAEFGFSDAESETAGSAFSSHDATPVAVATDGAIFGFQVSGAETLTAWSGLAVRNGTAQRVNTAIAPVAATFADLSVALIKSGSEVDAFFFVNGVQVGTISNAVTPTATMNVWASVVAKAGSASRDLDIDYIQLAGTRV